MRWDEDASDEQVSHSCLIYLFADHVVPRESHLAEHVLGRIAVPVPATKTLVALGDLEQQLLAVALWNLDAAQAIRLRRDPQLTRGRFSIEVGDRSVSWPGLEGRLLAMLPEEGTSVWKLVLDQWVADVSLPLNAVVVDAQEEAMNLGVIDTPETPVLVPGFFGHHALPEVVANEAKLAAFRPRFDEMAARWFAATDEHGGLGAELLKESNQVLYDARSTGRGSIGLGVPLV